MNGRDRRDLVDAAGGEDAVAAYCGSVTATPTATPTASKKAKKAKD